MRTICVILSKHIYLVLNILLKSPKTKIMEIYQFKKSIQKFVAILGLCFLSTALWAQDAGADVNVKITKEGSTWYTQPWVWIVGGAVFILLLVALLRGGGNKD